MENHPEKSMVKETEPSEVEIIGTEIVESLYPKLEKVASSAAMAAVTAAAAAAANQQPSTNSQTTQACVYQQTTVSYSRNGHSRNPSSINGITIATQVIQPASLNNKPDAKEALLRFIPFRNDPFQSNEQKRVCGNREFRFLCKCSQHAV